MAFKSNLEILNLTVLKLKSYIDLEAYMRTVLRISLYFVNIKVLEHLRTCYTIP